MKKQDLLNNLKEIIMSGDKEKFKKLIAQKQYIRLITKPYMTKGRSIHSIRWDYNDLVEMCGDNTREEMLMQLLDINYNKYDYTHEEMFNENILQVYKLDRDFKEKIDIGVMKFLIKTMKVYSLRSGNFPINNKLYDGLLGEQILCYDIEHGQKVINALENLRKQGYEFILDLEMCRSEECVSIMKKVGTFNINYIKEVIRANKSLYNIEEERNGYWNNYYLVLLLFQAYVENKENIDVAMEKAGIENTGKYSSIFVFNNVKSLSIEQLNHYLNKAIKEKLGLSYNGSIKDRNNRYTREFIEFWNKEVVLKENLIINKILEKDILDLEDYKVLYKIENENMGLAEIYTSGVQEIDGIPQVGVIELYGYNKKFINN